MARLSRFWRSGGTTYFLVNVNPRLTHFGHCRLTALWCHRSRRVQNEVNLEPGTRSIQSCGPDADVLSKTSDPNATNTLIAEKLRQSSLVDRRVLVFVKTGALGDNQLHYRQS